MNLIKDIESDLREIDELGLKDNQFVDIPIRNLRKILAELKRLDESNRD